MADSSPSERRAIAGVYAGTRPRIRVPLVRRRLPKPSTPRRPDRKTFCTGASESDQQQEGFLQMTEAHVVLADRVRFGLPPFAVCRARRHEAGKIDKWSIIFNFEYSSLPKDNIMLDDKGRAVIIDFGLSRPIEKSSSSAMTSLRDAGNVRWMAPELLFESEIRRGMEADVWGYACVAAQVRVSTAIAIGFSHS